MEPQQQPQPPQQPKPRFPRRGIAVLEKLLKRTPLDEKEKAQMEEFDLFLDTVTLTK